MAATFTKSNKMKRMECKKSHSWWWDSHISPKNSKWLQENLEEMDRHVKRMLKLIEEDADSFAKKAEMYYQKRPELISLVEGFYRMYRSLAERYDHVTGELRKNIPSDLQSQSSGISDVGSEPPSATPSPDRRPSRRKSGGPRAAGFDFFLGSGLDLCNKEGDESSTLDSESESDDSSINNYSSMRSNDDEHGLRRKILELEVELRELRENLESDRKIAKYEEELQVAKEEISRLTIELEKYNRTLGDEDNLLPEDVIRQNGREVLETSELQESINGSKAEVLHEIQTLEDELRISQEKRRVSEKEVESLREKLTSKESSIQTLQDQLRAAQKEVSVYKNKLDKEKREVSKLQDRVGRYKTNLSERDQEIRSLKEAISNANKTLSEENEQLQSEITRISKERAYLEDNIKEMDLRRQSLEEDMRRAKVIFGSQIEQLKAEIADKNESVDELKKNLDALQLKYNDLNDYITELVGEMSSKDDQIDQMNNHLNELHMEHVDLIAGAEGARKLAGELRMRIKELEREVERKEEIILEGAEEKREAIRQLCFSLEHYRNGYHRLRQAVIGHKILPVMAS